MDIMEKYRIQESIKDAIVILDSAPMHRDLSPDTNAVRLTNRAPIAHLAIERGMKSLINESGGCADPIHALNKLYRDLCCHDKAAADYLAKAFDEAVMFYGYNINVKGLTQFRSLQDYLGKVGTEKAFQALRYWAIEGSNSQANPMPYISLPIHREILWALWCAFLPSRRETVADRVDNEIAHAMFDARHKHIGYSPDDTSKEQAVHGYFNWLFKEHSTRRSALKEAVDKNFVLGKEEFVDELLREAYEELKKSEDPAMQYFLGRLSYLHKGSQRRNRDAVPDIQWSGEGEYRGMVVTPAGTFLGFIEKFADGGCGITPSEPGLVRITAIAESVGDAKHYLVNRLTRMASCVIKGERKQLRLCVKEHFGFRSTSSDRVWSSTDPEGGTASYDVEFWDACHGMKCGDSVAIGVVWNEVDTAASVLYGTVEDVENQKVSIIGSDVWTLKRSLEEWLTRTTQG